MDGSCQRARAKSVRTRPGAMQLTRTLRGPHSTARLRASCMSAAFETAYIPSFSEPRSPAILETRIALPFPRVDPVTTAAFPFRSNRLDVPIGRSLWTPAGEGQSELPAAARVDYDRVTPERMR